MSKVSRLKLIEPVQVTKAARSLSEAGQALWNRINGEFVLDDPASLELLLLACEATDRAAECRAAIERDGMVTMTQGGTGRAHCLIQHENAAQKFAASTINSLGLTYEPVKAIGRPTSQKIGMGR